MNAYSKSTVPVYINCLMRVSQKCYNAPIAEVISFCFQQIFCTRNVGTIKNITVTVIILSTKMISTNEKKLNKTS